MRCQAGDTAIVIRSGNYCDNRGRMVEIKHWVSQPIIGADGSLWLGGGWLCETLGHGLRTPVGTVMERLFDDAMLMPIRGEQEAVAGEEWRGIGASG